MADNTAPAKRIRKVAPVDPNETKGQKFIRIAKLRTNKALDAIASLNGLASKANYDYTPEQWDKIFNAMLNEMNKVKSAVAAGGVAAAEKGFDL